MQHHDLPAPAGANRRRKRVGRGESSGQGKTAGRGGKGQTARTGTGKPAPGFEGGQMPMYRRMPKRGFTNIFAIKTFAINLDALGQHFGEGAEVTLEILQAQRLASRGHKRLRVLGRGEAPAKLRICAHHVTGSAQKKIEAAGGSVRPIER